MSDLPGRIREAAEQVGGLNQLAVLTGVPRRTLGHWLQGRKPKPEALGRISEVAQVDLNWLITGEGEKFDTPLSRVLRKAGAGSERGRELGKEKFEEGFHLAMQRIVTADDAPDRGADVDEQLMESLAKMATNVYAEMKQRPPVEKITVEATRLLNRLMQVADLRDPEEVSFALPLLRYQLQKRLAEAAQSPGNGKRSAS